MLTQQDSFKLGERSPRDDSYYCEACDGQGVETLAEVAEAHAFPFCKACSEAGRPEVDQLWVPLSRREDYRRARDYRRREVLKD
jgi:hypothetical protein